MASASVSPLLNLQIELQLEIASYLKTTPAWQQDLCSWSSVCSHFRTLLTPFLFDSITLRNTEKSGDSVARLSKSRFARYIRTFHFLGNAPGDTEDAFTDVGAIFPKIVEEIIADLTRFPNLETVQIEFEMDFDSDWEEGFMLFQDTESPEEREQAEQKEAWRALNTNVYKALARNIDPKFTKLHLIDLIPAEASAFSTVQFQTLLCNLTSFELSCWTSDGGDYSANTRLGYVMFLDKLDSLFFDHLSSLTDLIIDARDLPVSFRSYQLAESQRLNRTRIPLLKNIHLTSLFITRGLIYLMATQAHCLEKVHLEDCHAGRAYVGDDISCWWDDLFDAIADKNPNKLYEFDVFPSSGFELFDDYHSSRAEKEEAARALVTLQESPHLRLFSYSYIDDKYGFVGSIEESNLASFRVGKDQRAYDRLCRIVAQNARKKAVTGDHTS